MTYIDDYNITVSLYDVDQRYRQGNIMIIIPCGTANYYLTQCIVKPRHHTCMCYNCGDTNHPYKCCVE